MKSIQKVFMEKEAQNEKHRKSTELLELIRTAATQFGRCCKLYQDSLGGFHCHQCGQATFRMLRDVQELLGESKDVSQEAATKRAIQQNAAPQLVEALKITVRLTNGDPCEELDGKPIDFIKKALKAAGEEKEDESDRHMDVISRHHQ